MEQVDKQDCGRPTGTGQVPDVDTRLALARSRCERHGARLTPLRAAVLQILLQEQRFFTAYELVEQMREACHNTPAMTVYRVLDFLITQGLVYRLDTVNGYVAARSLPCKGRCMVAICTRCSKVIEMDVCTLEDILDTELARVGFVSDSGVLELRVMCDRCRPDVLREAVLP